MRSDRFFSIPALMQALRGIILFAGALALIIAVALPLHAEEQLPDTFMLRAGGYFLRNANTVMRLDSSNLPIGTYMDFSETLGGDTTTTVARADGLFRFNENHGLGFTWYSIKLAGSRTLDTDINWGGEIFPGGVTVDSEIKFSIYKLNYQYSLFHNDKVELGALIGFHVMRVFASVAGSNNRAESETITAPLPVLGLFAQYKFTPRFSAYYNYQFFFIDYEDKARGGLQDFLFGLEYRLFRHFSLGVAYNRFSSNLELEDNTKRLTINSGWNGGLAYAGLYF